jgi:hypothetical protein
VTSFLDPAVATGTTYFYQVIAVYPDGSEGASVAVQYPAPTTVVALTTEVAPTTVVATTTTVTRQGSRSAPTKLAPTIALRASTLTATGQYNRVTLTWQPVSTNLGTITYEVRRAQVDPASPGTPIGYISGSPTLQPDGSFVAIDPLADLHLPTWYRVTTKSTSQGNIDSPWYRRDPPPHRGVDTIIGGYWRGTNLPYTWSACIRWSQVPGAAMYWARVRTASGAWVNVEVKSDIAIIQKQPVQTGSGALNRITGFDTYSSQYAALQAPLENGDLLQIQVGPLFSPNNVSPPWITDLNHLQPVHVSFAKSAVPLKAPNCQP